MSVKIIPALLCAVFAAFSMTSCGKAENSGNSENTSVREEASMMNILPNEENVKPLGRAYFMDDKLYCTLSGTGAAFTFTGTECTVHITGDSTASGDNNLARVGIYVNGERVIDDMIDNPEETYSVFKSETEQTAEVKIVKLSEAPMSTFAIGTIDVTGTEVKPAADKERFIEFIGDSITCGYGVDDEDANHSFSTGTEDVTKAYAYKTAENLDADYSMVSFSGHGIISGYSDGTKKVSAQTVPQFYTKLGYVYSTNGNFNPRETSWDFGKRQPDVIVINLGTNDDSYCKNKEDRCEEYRAEYVEFLKKIRENNPDAQIICTLGIMGANLYPYIELAVSDYTSETGDTKVTSMMFEQQNQSEDGIAADWHPTERTHTKAADKLTEKIKEVMGW